jgi:hypothetical protein
MSKFKVGDKVRILPSAVAGGVDKTDVGKIGRITGWFEGGGYFTVVMNHWTTLVWSWAVYPNQMEHAVEIGAQLVFDFMSE